MINTGKDMADHILKRFDDELEKLNGRIAKMAAAVQDQVAGAMAALRDGDAARAAGIVEMDDKIDAYDVKIEKLCMRLLALQQPVALDLRTVLSALAVNRYLERIGDGAVNVAERVALLAAHPALLRQTRLLDMGEIAAAMVRDSIEAFLASDITLARSVALRDNLIDEYDTQNFEVLTGIMAREPSLVVPASHLLMVSRNLERLADEATNIAEAAVFVADAKIVKHGGWGVHTDDSMFDDEAQEAQGERGEDAEPPATETPA